MKKKRTLKKIGLFSMHTAPYKDPVFEEIMDNRVYDVEVITLFTQANTHKEWNNNSTPQYRNTFLGKHISLPVLGEFHFGVLKILTKNRYDAIMVTGYYPLTSLVILLYAFITKTPFVYTADSTFLPFEDMKIKNGLKMKFLKNVMKRAGAVWVPGEASQEYHSKLLNISKNKIFKGSYTLDSAELYEKIYQFSSDKKSIKASLGIKQEAFMFLFVGKLIPTRNINNLLMAFKEASSVNNNIALLIIGDGPETEIVEDFLSKNKEIGVRHIGAVTFEELYPYYGCSDAYIHPGAEPYSLALVEAVIAGKPVVSTNEVGSVYDYVKNCYNGFIVSNNDVVALTEAIVNMGKSYILEVNVKEMQKFAVNQRSKLWATNQLMSAINLSINGS